MSRIIIDNRSGLSDAEALRRVSAVVDKGRMSNGGKQYCYAVGFADGGLVYSDLIKTGDKFTVLPPQ